LSRGKGGAQGRTFFFEKKNQKTFVMIKVFFASFSSEKEDAF
jgi:hypothetical protein